MRKLIKLGHQAPVGWRVNSFNSIDIRGDFAYCKSHNFIYDTDIESIKLHWGIPCRYTDIRYTDGRYNYYKQCQIHWTRFKDISLKACIRKTLACRNIPKGTSVIFEKSWHYEGKKIDNSYVFKITKENHFDPDYQITDPRFSDNFSTCGFSQELTKHLRASGFLVKVEKNTSFLMNMFNTAVQATGGKNFANSRITGEVAVAYGFGKRIGYSSYNDDFMGYSCGCDNILWNTREDFDKWSCCNEISKKSSIMEIIDILKADQKIEE